jgi:hypothetical protein
MPSKKEMKCSYKLIEILKITKIALPENGFFASLKISYEPLEMLSRGI